MKYLLITLLLLASFTAYSQEYVHISYDPHGNRTGRRLTHVGDNRVPAPSRTKETDNDSDNATSIDNAFSENNVQITTDEEVNRIQVSIQESGGDISLSLFSSSGQLLQHQEAEDADYTLDLSDYPTGVYILSLRKDEQMKEYKIVKK